jgi:hypothetical protein
VTVHVHPVLNALPEDVPGAADRKAAVMKKETLEKIFEYASSPVHGTLSRKLRKDISCRINGDKSYTNATLFLGEEFVRITENDNGKLVNTYYDWEKIASVCTVGQVEE